LSRRAVPALKPIALKILLVQVGLYGDCLLATVLARQIKEVDYPNCHLTWAIGSNYKQSIYLNPHVDEIWEITNQECLTDKNQWDQLLFEIKEKQEAGCFDLIIVSQGLGENWLKFDGGLRSSAYRSYPHKITVSPEPVIQLSSSEIENVKHFAETHQLEKYKNVILVEYGPTSFSSDLNLQSGYDFALDFAAENQDTAIILSANSSFSSPLKNVINAGGLSFRENAELSKYCSLFIGCGSGISWLMTSSWAKKLNTVLLVNQNSGILPSLNYDHQFLNLPTDHIIEIKNGSNSFVKLKKCLNEILISGFAEARHSFNEKIPVTNHHFLYYQLRNALDRNDWESYFLAFQRYFKRNGFLAGKNIGLLMASKIFLLTLRHLQTAFKRKMLNIFNKQQILSANKMSFLRDQESFDEK
jgi:hypothetical protein